MPRIFIRGASPYFLLQPYHEKRNPFPQNKTCYSLVITEFSFSRKKKVSLQKERGGLRGAWNAGLHTSSTLVLLFKELITQY